MLISLINNLTTTWKHHLLEETKLAYFTELDQKITKAYDQFEIYPAPDNIFKAFSFFDLEATKVVILGQDPYHSKNQANGLSFAVNQGMKIPPSLNNIFKELRTDLNVVPPSSDLISWAQQGVLLLNTILTVQAHLPLSHEAFGWKTLVITQLKNLLIINPDTIFILWGNIAQNLVLPLKPRHYLKSAHPSFYSAVRFFGTKPFSKTNQILKSLHKSIINW